jgi:hypothetical protein
VDDDAWKKARREFGGVCQQSRFCISNAGVTDGRSRRLTENASRTLGGIFKLAVKNAFLAHRTSLKKKLNTRNSHRAAVSQIDTGKLTRRFLESSRLRGNPNASLGFRRARSKSRERKRRRAILKLLFASPEKRFAFVTHFWKRTTPAPEGVPSR